MTEEEVYYQTMERLHNCGFRCDCDPNKPTPGCVICNPLEHNSIRSDPIWADWIKKE
jgi:hypothetical protein